MKKSGFTLIELIFVIVIIGLLAAVAVPKFLTTKKNAETANLPVVGKQIVNKAEEQYNLVQDANLTHIIQNDQEIVDYNNSLAGTKFKNDEHNETDYRISYDQDGDGKGDSVCLHVERETKTIPVTKTTSVQTYDFRIVELNTSCNSDKL